MKSARTHFCLAALVAGLVNVAVAFAAAPDDAFQSLAGGIKARSLAQGEGPVAEPGMIATIQFVGWLDEGGARGREFFNSHREGTPISFLIGTDKVMPAWNEGVVGMRAGGKRMLLVPPEMGYGNKSVEGVVPANASLMMQIELVKLEVVPEQAGH